jgi:hypothetical protein
LTDEVTGNANLIGLDALPALILVASKQKASVISCTHILPGISILGHRLARSGRSNGLLGLVS